jgi:predicted HicB family RNase H-like nuclease
MGRIDGQLNIRVEKELAERAHREARRRGKSLSALIREYLRSLLAGC